MQLAIIYIPFLQPLFKTIPLGLYDWAIILPASLTGLIFSEIWKKKR